MIENLLPLTKNKLDILNYIYENNGAYTSELSKKLNIYPFSIKRTLESLKNKKILESKNVGRTKIFSLNKTEPSLIEVIFLIEKYKLSLIDKLIGRLVKNIQIFFSVTPEIYCSCLFGSYAKNSQTTKSDIDLLFIVKNKRKIKTKIINKCSELSILLNKEVSPIILEEKEFLTMIRLKEPALISLLTPSQRVVIFGVEYLHAHGFV